jgi:predicted nuclease of predicted toxin-antitoxin system
MNQKFLVDECVGLDIANWLQEQGYDAISIYDIATGSDDNEVLEKAFTENRILITCDKDFGEMIFKGQKQHVGVILLRLANEKPSHTILILKNLFDHYSHDLFGNFVVVSESVVRITRQTFS